MDFHFLCPFSISPSFLSFLSFPSLVSQEDEEAAFLLKKAQEEAESEAKTSKNKAKRDKKKAAKAAHLAASSKGIEDPNSNPDKKRKSDGDGLLSREDADGNKRRLVKDEKLGEALKFRKRESDDEE